MPSLKPKYEAFCQFYAESPHAGIAAENAGYTGRNVDKQGWRLLQRPEIVARIAEIRAAQAAIESLSLIALLAKLEEACQIARHNSDAMALARIAEIQAKLPAVFAKSGGEIDPPGAEPTRAALTRIARELGVVAPRDAPAMRGA